MQTIFKVEDKIRNKKSGKLGKIIKVYEEGVIKYHLLRTPNNIHTFTLTDNRFEIIVEKEKIWGNMKQKKFKELN